MRLIRDLSLLLLLSLGLPVGSQERQPLDTDANLLLHSANPSAGDVDPKDLNPEHYKVHGGAWREMTSEDDDDIPPGTNLATDGNGELN